jgi:Glyoxalase-like domain
VIHRSRLLASLVDVPHDVFDREVAFWSGVLGRPPAYDPEDPDYADFDEPTPGWQFVVQRVDDSARVHLDVETDDVEAEVQRLESLGARRVKAIRDWWVLRDPAGLVFCVVPVQSPEAFAAHATTWPDLPE